MQRVVTQLVDDIDGSEAEETVSFSIDGVSYEIDLSSKNADGLRQAVSAYVSHARKTGGRRRVGRAKSNGDATSAEIREWAEAAGLTVSHRGRVSAEIRQAYAKAH